MNGSRGMGVLWWTFNSTVCIAGGIWALSIGLWWGMFGIVFGVLGIPILLRKLRARNYF